MENTFSNNEPKRSAMKRFCDLLRNIADHCVAILQYRSIALLVISLYRSIAKSKYHNIAGAWHMTILVNLFPAICDMRRRISAV